MRQVVSINWYLTNKKLNQFNESLGIVMIHDIKTRTNWKAIWCISPTPAMTKDACSFTLPERSWDKTLIRHGNNLTMKQIAGNLNSHITHSKYPKMFCALSFWQRPEASLQLITNEASPTSATPPHAWADQFHWRQPSHNSMVKNQTTAVWKSSQNPWFPLEQNRSHQVAYLTGLFLFHVRYEVETSALQPVLSLSCPCPVRVNWTRVTGLLTNCHAYLCTRTFRYPDVKHSQLLSDVVAQPCFSNA